MPCAWHAGPVTHFAGSEVDCPAAGKSGCPEIFCVLSLVPPASPNTPACLLLPLPLGQVVQPAPFLTPLGRAALPVDADTVDLYLSFSNFFFYCHPVVCYRRVDY